VSDAHNRSGQAYSLTVLTPVRDGHEVALAAHLDGLGGGDDSPLADVGGTHFARWVVIGDVIYEGSDQGERDHLKHPRLLFTSNFDGDPGPYLEALRTRLGEGADAIWGHCVDYPGREDADAFTRYLRAHQVDSALFFAAYGDRSVADVTHSLAVRRQLITFALRAQGLDGAELKSAFAQEFGT
jgi:hypothetical protein